MSYLMAGSIVASVIAFHANWAMLSYDVVTGKYNVMIRNFLSMVTVEMFNGL